MAEVSHFPLQRLRGEDILLDAQWRTEHLILVSRDPSVDAYGVRRRW